MTTTPASRALGLLPLRPRRPDEPHRAASPLELFFDLVFVVAVSLSSAQLHHAESEQHIGAGIGAYVMVFFAIWWAWMNFTWFASAFDNDDWLYRLLTIFQMAGVLVLAAGTPAAMTDGDFLLVTLGYVVMRLAMVAQWLRAAHDSPDLRATALRYVAGIATIQVLWVARLFLPGQGGVLTFLVLAVAEVAVPVVAESRRTTPWHPRHIAERYGLFTLIVLGESILASANAIIDAAENDEHLAPLITLAVCGLVLAAGMWWIYFAHEHHEGLDSQAHALRFGYGHYLIFAAAGAFSAGIEVAIDSSTHSTDVGPAAAAATLTVPVAVFILGVWWLTLRTSLSRLRNSLVVLITVLIGLSALVGNSLLIAAGLTAAIVVLLEVPERTRRAPR